MGIKCKDRPPTESARNCAVYSHAKMCNSACGTKISFPHTELVPGIFTGDRCMDPPRLARALSDHELFCISAEEVGPAFWEFLISGTTGKPYKIRVGKYLNCTCPDRQFHRAVYCKHLVCDIQELNCAYRCSIGYSYESCISRSSLS